MLNALDNQTVTFTAEQNKGEPTSDAVRLGSPF